ncbi:MAG: recombinase RecT [Eggerthellaceae bacterium]|nr:recombinase RecT [Eggerthellaceae bacterium]
MGQLAQATQGQQLQAAGHTAQNGIADMLKHAWPRIQAVMPKHMSSERMYQIALSAINTTPKLAECSPATILSCVMKCSALGLEPSAVDGLGRAYILPYRSKQGMQAQLILGYKGMIALARRSGEIKDISARAVYEGDEFDYSFGLDEHLSHKPAAREHKDGEKPTHVYMVAHFKDGGHYMDVMTFQEVEAIRKRSKAANNGPWVTDYEAMAKKTVIRRAFPYLPVSVEAMNAAASDDTDGGFVDQLEHAPIISEQDFEVPAQEQPQDTEPKGLRKAVCKSCGSTIEVAADATLEDVAANMPPCCENMQLEWADGE